MKCFQGWINASRGTYFTLLSNGFVGGSISEIFLAHFAYTLVDFSSPTKKGDGKIIAHTEVLRSRLSQTCINQALYQHLVVDCMKKMGQEIDYIWKNHSGNSI